MKKYLLLLVPIFAIAATVFLTADKISPSNKEFNEENEGGEISDDWLFDQKAFPYGKIDKKAQRFAVNAAMNQKQKNINSKITDVDDWHFIGPVTIGGRILDIVCPPGNDNTIYVGTASGGVLKSYNGGDTWQNIFDENPTLSIGDIAIDPVDTNLIYVGTGEPGNGTGSVTYDGNGIYKSTNGGDTWTNIGLTEGGNTGRIAINQDNPQIIFAAMLGDLFENSAERGIYRTENGGTTWEKVLFVNDSTGGIDVTINPDDPDIIYASTWERVRRYNRKDYSGFGSRIYRSEDGGDTWTMLTNGLPNAALAKITLALAPSNPNIIYAAIVNSSESLEDIYKTVDGGDTWIALDCEDEVATSSQDTWFGGVRVNPFDANKVYWVGFTCSRSNNGGNSWNGFATSAHVDCHALYISPTNENFKIMGSDGGLFFTDNDFATYTTDQNIPVTQLYTIDIYPGDTSRMIGGAQDNGSFIRDAAGNWSFVNGGDGVSTKFVPVDEDSYYANYQYGGYYGYVGGTDVFFGLPSDRYNWRSPVEVNPLNPKTIYFAGAKVYRTNNYGNFSATISDDLTNGSQGIGLTFGSIFTIHNAPADTNYIYIGTDDANVWRSKDYGDNWELITDGLPYRYCMSIETDPDDAETVYVTFSGFRWAEDIAHIYKSTNAGDTWTNISGDMPDFPVNDIQIGRIGDTTALMIATDVGCYYSYNDGVNWNLLGISMPIVSVYEIYFDTESATLFAGTYGRGLWKIAMPQKEPPQLSIDEILDLDIQIYPNPVADHILIAANQQLNKATLNLFNATGELIYSEKINGEVNVTIPALNLPAGNYFIEMNMAGSRVVKKVVKI
ncbi:MAG: T9SS type A sorting domain-containing protein [Chitinophagales bacterium]